MPSSNFFLLNYENGQYARNFSELATNDLISLSNNASRDKKLVLLAPYYKHCNITPKLLFFVYQIIPSSSSLISKLLLICAREASGAVIQLLAIHLKPFFTPHPPCRV